MWQNPPDRLCKVRSFAFYRKLRMTIFICRNWTSMTGNRRSFKYAAFYDLDRTVLKDNSATHLVHTARVQGIMSEKQFRNAVWLSILYKLRIGDSSKMIRRMLSWIRGSDEQKVNELCREIFESILVKDIRPLILETLTMHRKAGGALVLLTSATENISRHVAEHLDLDGLICTRLEVERGIFTGHVEGSPVYGLEKKKQMQDFCEHHGMDPSGAYYYGDSYSDRHVMEAVGHPVAVDPDRCLLRLAQDRQWQILLRDRC